MKEGLFDGFLARLVRRGRLEVTYASGATSAFGEPAEGYPEVALRFTDDKVPRDLLLDPGSGAGKAYMDGRILIERGDVLELVTLARMNHRFERFGRLHTPGALTKLKRRLAFLRHSFNDAKSARRNVSHHYDIGNDLYRLMLDREHMQYSCAYWPSDDMTLEQAQAAKLAHIAAKLALASGQRVLDIGCGWGGMAIYLARHFGVEVLGITLSQQQLALAEERVREAGVADRVRFELVDYRDLASRGERFDRIVSVGMFEHVGRPQFETFFRACANLLANDGVMLLHTIGRMGGPGTTDEFTDKYIFPGGYIPALSETVAASERVRLIATDVETLRLHYAKTLREWYKRCMTNREAIVAMYDERFFRMWTFYLAGAVATFESGGMCNYQIQYARDRRALPLTRGYIEQAEQALRGGSI
jgi:cyclopropane-fatty-acyl-phospholipid synthase